MFCFWEVYYLDNHPPLTKLSQPLPPPLTPPLTSPHLPYTPPSPTPPLRYYFDIHPPLTKLLIALTAFLFGYDGSQQWEYIGQPIEPQVGNKVSRRKNKVSRRPLLSDTPSPTPARPPLLTSTPLTLTPTPQQNPPCQSTPSPSLTPPLRPP